MKAGEKYHKWVEWSEDDQVYIGKCPDLITGIHGADPAKLYEELVQVIDDIVAEFKELKKPLPPARVRPMQEV